MHSTAVIHQKTDDGCVYAPQWNLTCWASQMSGMCFQTPFTGSVLFLTLSGCPAHSLELNKSYFPFESHRGRRASPAATTREARRTFWNSSPITRSSWSFQNTGGHCSPLAVVSLWYLCNQSQENAYALKRTLKWVYTDSRLILS